MIESHTAFRIQSGSTLPSTNAVGDVFIRTDGTYWFGSAVNTFTQLGTGAGTVTSVSFTGGLISVATPTTTPALTVAGISGGMPYFSSTSTWASSALLGANLPMMGGGAGVAPSTLVSPGANTLLGFDNTDGTTQFLTIGSGLTYTHSSHTLSASGTGANQTLSNLTSPTAINQALIFGTGLGNINQVQGPTDQPFQLVAQAPAVAGTSTAGNAISLTASAATAGNVTAGAAAGGPLNFTTGAAAQLTSGNANGGNFAVTLGAGIGTGTNGVATFTASDAGTTNSLDVLQVIHNSSGGGSINTLFGAAIRFGLQSTTTANRDAGRIEALWATATDASRVSTMSFFITNNSQALQENFRITGHSANASNFLTLEVGTNNIYLYPTNNNANAFNFMNASGSSGTCSLSIDTSNNRVGIGTTSPADMFDVNHNFEVTSSGQFSKYKGVSTTSGWGVPAIYGNQRSTGATGAVTLNGSGQVTVGASDGSFEVSANVNITTFSAGTFTVTCTYTDETNTSRTLTLNFSSVGGTLATAIAAAGAFEGVPLHIRAKASTTITIASTGTFTSLTYNIEGIIKQMA